MVTHVIVGSTISRRRRILTGVDERPTALTELMQVVVAVLLDNFTSAADQEKARKAQGYLFRLPAADRGE